VSGKAGPPHSVPLGPHGNHSVRYLLSFIKSFVYDSYHRLCRTTEPESISTVMAHDDAGNVIWDAAGLAITGSDFHGQKRGNDTHASTTAPDARPAHKGRGSQACLAYLANALMENRNGLLIGVDVRHATGTGERDGVLALVDAHLAVGATLGADKGYDVADFVEQLSARGIKAHLAHHTRNSRYSTFDARTARGKGYKISLQVRKRIEQSFGWVKTVGDLRKLPLVGLPKVKAWVHWNFAAYNLIRLGGIGQWWNPSPT